MQKTYKEKKRAFDEKCEKVMLELNDAQNERQKTENKAFTDYMDKCNDILEKYGIFPKDHPPSDVNCPSSKTMNVNMKKKC